MGAPGYFSRWFCRMEASAAMAMNKPTIIVFENDPRHKGEPDYVKLVDKVISAVRFTQSRQWMVKW